MRRSSLAFQDLQFPFRCSAVRWPVVSDAAQSHWPSLRRLRFIVALCLNAGLSGATRSLVDQTEFFTIRPETDMDPYRQFLEEDKDSKQMTNGEQSNTSFGRELVHSASIIKLTENSFQTSTRAPVQSASVIKLSEHSFQTVPVQMNTSVPPGSIVGSYARIGDEQEGDTADRTDHKELETELHNYALVKAKQSEKSKRSNMDLHPRLHVEDSGKKQDFMTTASRVPVQPDSIIKLEENGFQTVSVQTNTGALPSSIVGSFIHAGDEPKGTAADKPDAEEPGKEGKVGAQVEAKQSGKSMETNTDLHSQFHGEKNKQMTNGEQSATALKFAEKSFQTHLDNEERVSDKDRLDRKQMKTGLQFNDSASRGFSKPSDKAEYFSLAPNLSAPLDFLEVLRGSTCTSEATHLILVCFTPLVIILLVILGVKHSLRATRPVPKPSQKRSSFTPFMAESMEQMQSWSRMKLDERNASTSRPGYGLDFVIREVMCTENVEVGIIVEADGNTAFAQDCTFGPSQFQSGTRAAVFNEEVHIVVPEGAKAIGFKVIEGGTGEMLAMGHVMAERLKHLGDDKPVTPRMKEQVKRFGDDKTIEFRLTKFGRGGQVFQQEPSIIVSKTAPDKTDPTRNYLEAAGSSISGSSEELAASAALRGPALRMEDNLTRDEPNAELRSSVPRKSALRQSITDFKDTPMEASASITPFKKRQSKVKFEDAADASTEADASTGTSRQSKVNFEDASSPAARRQSQVKFDDAQTEVALHVDSDSESSDRSPSVPARQGLHHDMQPRATKSKKSASHASSSTDKPRNLFFVHQHTHDLEMDDNHEEVLAQLSTYQTEYETEAMQYQASLHAEMDAEHHMLDAEQECHNLEDKVEYMLDHLDEANLLLHEESKSLDYAREEEHHFKIELDESSTTLEETIADVEGHFEHELEDMSVQYLRAQRELEKFAEQHQAHKGSSSQHLTKMSEANAAMEDDLQNLSDELVSARKAFSRELQELENKKAQQEVEHDEMTEAYCTAEMHVQQLEGYCELLFEQCEEAGVHLSTLPQEEEESFDGGSDTKRHTFHKIASYDPEDNLARQRSGFAQSSSEGNPSPNARGFGRVATTVAKSSSEGKPPPDVFGPRGFGRVATTVAKSSSEGKPPPNAFSPKGFGRHATAKGHMDLAQRRTDAQDEAGSSSLTPPVKHEAR